MSDEVLRPELVAGPGLVVTLPGPHRSLSWALVGGGLTDVAQVGWRQVSDRDLGAEVDPLAVAQRFADEYALCQPLVFLTACDIRRYAVTSVDVSGVRADAVATVGLANRLRIGDSPGPLTNRPDTINILCRVSVGLTDSALVEAMSLVVEARTAAVVDAGLESRRSGRPATGTGTDCVAMCAPHQTEAHLYAGKHTALGAAIGQAVYRAVVAGIQEKNTWDG